MKKTILLLILSLTIISCTKSSTNEEVNQNQTAIVGKWQVVEDLDYNPPGPYPVTNGTIIDLHQDGTFTSDELTTYTGGTYTFSTSDIIDFTFTSLTQGSFVKRQKLLSISNNELILSNDLSPNGAGCIEGCALRYSKINSTPTISGKK